MWHGRLSSPTSEGEEEVVIIKLLAYENDRAAYYAKAKTLVLLDHENVVAIRGASFFPPLQGLMPNDVQTRLIFEYCNGKFFIYFARFRNSLLFFLFSRPIGQNVGRRQAKRRRKSSSPIGRGERHSVFARARDTTQVSAAAILGRIFLRLESPFLETFVPKTASSTRCRKE